MTAIKSSRFELRVHAGLLMLITLLIGLSFTSNFVIFNARTSRKSTLAIKLESAAFSISRSLSYFSPLNSKEEIDHFENKYHLSGLMVLPSMPADPSQAARRKWLLEFANDLPVTQLPELARKILSADFRTLARGDREEYFYVYPVSSADKKHLLILSVDSPDLAYLDDASKTVLVVTVVSTLLIIMIYLFLVRYIFAPYRKLRQQALKSGRAVAGGDNEAEEVVEDYRRVINELKEKEQKLIELNRQVTSRADSLEQFNDYLLESSDSGIVTLDREGIILSINDACSEMFGVSNEDFIASTYRELFAEQQQLVEAIERVIFEKENLPYSELVLTLKDGSKTTFGFTVSTVSDSHQQPIGASIIFSNINEIARLRNELEIKKQLAALGEMSGGLAHQLRNSMGAISGFCRLLKNQFSENSLENEYLTDLLNETKETEELVERFLSFARPLEYRPEISLLSEMFREIESTLRPQLEQKKINLHFGSVASNGQEVKIEIDALLIKQALINIIENAINACDETNGTVSVEAELSDNEALITVTDNGSGISSEHLYSIFTPFFSLKPSGTGLGLPLAAKIVNLHGGQIKVYSTEGSGSKFEIYLPLNMKTDSKPVSSI